METNTAENHTRKVRVIADAVRRHLSESPASKHFSLSKAVVSHTVPQPDDPKNRDRKIDVSSLTEILEIDLERRTCTAESGVTFERLVRATLPHGLLPTTVSELRSITIGGAVAGCSVESMSFRYGGFHDGCTACEVVTGTGDIVEASRERNTELFEMVHGSFGTLGILTSLTFRLVPAAPYVRVSYERYASVGGLLEAIRKHKERDDLDFMDAIAHAPDRLVLCAGRFSERAPYTNRYFSSPYYRSTTDRDEDYLETEEYLFRYDSDCHWIARNYGLENPILRAVAGRFFLGSTRMLSLAKKLPFLESKERPDVVVDVFLPARNMERFFSWYGETFSHYPLWIVPYRIERMYPWINPALVAGNDDDLFIDCAIYGFRQRGDTNYYRALEEKVLELGGVKTLITHNYYPEEEFWATYNRGAYERIKLRADPAGIFRDLYLKTNYHVLGETEQRRSTSAASRRAPSSPRPHPEESG